MTALESTDQRVVRDERGNISRVVELVTDRHGRLTRRTKHVTRDEAGNLSGVHVTTEDLGWSREAIERLRERHEAEKLTRRNRSKNVTELQRTRDGSFSTRSRSAIGGR